MLVGVLETVNGSANLKPDKNPSRASYVLAGRRCGSWFSSLIWHPVNNYGDRLCKAS